MHKTLKIIKFLKVYTNVRLNGGLCSVIGKVRNLILRIEQILFMDKIMSLGKTIKISGIEFDFHKEKTIVLQYIDILVYTCTLFIRTNFIITLVQKFKSKHKPCVDNTRIFFRETSI